MATPESYRPDESVSSPAPPKLPERQPDRFQFSLKQLLAFMFASAFAAMGLRQLMLNANQWEAGVVNTTLIGLAIGGLLYFFIRFPFVLFRGGRLSRRWRQIQQHRRELQAWGEARKKEQPAEAQTPDVPPVK
jgi:hypothetical protein